MPPSYFAWAIPQIVISVDTLGLTVAWVPTTNSNDPFVVWIDETNRVPQAAKCSCSQHWYKGVYCHHMQVVDLYYQRIAGIVRQARELIALATKEQQEAA